MYEYVMQAAHQTAHDIVQARILDEDHLKAIAPALAATAIYDATEQQLRRSAIQRLTEDDLSRREYAQSEALFIREFITTYRHLSLQA